ncbi:hypothetical protein V6N13_104817 [Hibiscus sabdariffa]
MKGCEQTREPEKDHDVTNVSRDSVSPFQQVNEVTDVVYDPWMILANRRCRSPKTSTTAYGLSLASEVATRLTKVDSRQGHSRGKAGNSQEVSTVQTQDGLWFSQGVASDTIDGTCDSQRVMLVAESGGGVIEAPNESPHAMIRKGVWHNLTALKQNFDEAWLLEGDFNTILRMEEREGGSVLSNGDNPQFEEFLCESWDTSLDVRANICAFQIKRRRTNFVEALRKPDGVWCSNQKRFQCMATDFYKDLFTRDPLKVHVYETRGHFLPPSPTMV